MSGMVGLAESFFDAAAGQDLETVRRLYREDAVVWHNWSEAEQTVEENLATLGGIPRRYESFGYEQVRCIAVEDGFLRQHVIRASRAGRTALVPAIVRAYVEDGRIRRIKEYFDRGQLDNQLA